MTAVLSFDEASHTYTLGARRLPSVTQILAPLVDFSKVLPNVLERKRDLGSRVHAAAHFDDEDDLDEDSIEEDVLPYLGGWRRFRAETGARVVSCETRVFDASVGFAGSLDRVIELNHARWLIDLKTAFSLPHTVGPQTAAYLRALADPSVTRRGVIRLRPDGSYRLDSLTDPSDWSVFLACLTIHKFKETIPL